jgi:hypothetical protein
LSSPIISSSEPNPCVCPSPFECKAPLPDPFLETQKIIDTQFAFIDSNPNFTDFERCQKVNAILLHEIDPIWEPYHADLMDKIRGNCSSCTISEELPGCPWDVVSSTP